MAFWRSERLDFSTVWPSCRVHCASDPMSAASPTPVAAPILELNHRKSGLRLVVAALLSALLPGTGHLLMKRWSKGVFILLLTPLCSPPASGCPYRERSPAPC